MQIEDPPGGSAVADSRIGRDAASVGTRSTMTQCPAMCAGRIASSRGDCTGLLYQGRDTSDSAALKLIKTPLIFFF